MENFDWRQLNLGPRTKSRLEKYLKGNLLNFTVEQLMEECHLQPKSIQELREQLGLINLKLKDDVSSIYDFYKR